MLNLLFLIALTGSGSFAATAAPRPPDVLQGSTTGFTSFTFTTRDGLTLRWVRYDQTSPNLHPLVIAPGCGESVYRYDALVRDLLARGYGPIYILEHRGQGHSEGTGARADLVYVDHFSDYVTDFKDFMHGPIAADLAARGFNSAPDVIAHSMGGAIANLALHDEPTLVSKIAYVAPMMDINTAILNPGEDALALWAAKWLCVLGLGDRLAVSGTGGKRRLQIPGVAREVAEGIFRGGVTPAWLRESIRATRVIRRQAASHAETSLVVVAKRDQLVQPRALREYAERARNTTRIEIDGPHGLHHDARSEGPLVDALDQFFGGCERRLGF